MNSYTYIHHVCVCVFKKLAHVIMEAEKSKIWRPRRADVVHSSPSLKDKRNLGVPIVAQQ